MSRRSTAAPLLAALALLAAPLTLSACSSDADPAPATTAASGSWSSAMGSCLRAQGYDVADSDLVEGVVAPPDGVDVDTYASDWETCRSALPEAIGGGDQEPSAEDLAAWHEANLRVAQCVRDAGFPDFADPVDGEWSAAMSTSDDDPLTRAFLDCSDEHGSNAEGAEG